MVLIALFLNVTKRCALEKLVGDVPPPRFEPRLLLGDAPLRVFGVGVQLGG